MLMCSVIDLITIVEIIAILIIQCVMGLQLDVKKGRFCSACSLD